MRAGAYAHHGGGEEVDEGAEVVLSAVGVAVAVPLSVAFLSSNDELFIFLAGGEGKGATERERLRGRGEKSRREEECGENVQQYKSCTLFLSTHSTKGC